MFVCFFSVSSSSWYLGRTAVCDCGTPWTFLLPFMCSECHGLIVFPLGISGRRCAVSVDFLGHFLYFFDDNSTQRP